MTRRQSPTLITLGRTIRAFREHAGMIQLELAKQLGYTNAWLSNIETGQIRPREDQLAAIEDVLKIPDGVLMTIRKQHDGESLPGHFRPWSGEEWLATVIRTFHVALIPDLLQTEDYARALSGDETAVHARMERQRVLTREDPAPPMFHCVIDEAVLHRDHGGPAVMRDQLLHLIKLVAPPRLTVQILRSADNPYPFGPFALATVDDGEVGLIETPVRDIVTNSREDLTGLTAAWEAVRTFALSQRDSTELIQQIADDRQLSSP